MSKCKQKNHYKEVKNFIHNEAKITKEFIKEVVEETVKYEITKILKDETYMNNLVKSQIKEVMKNDFEKPHWQRIFNLDTEIYNAVCDEVSQMVKDKLELRFKDSPESE